MPQPRALIFRTAGTNCDRETQFALRQEGFEADRLHVYRLFESPEQLAEYDLLVIPGGFSYGDDVAAGKILAHQMLHRLAEPLNRFVDAGKLVLGICNGFQVLLKSGLLPQGRVEPGQAHHDATLGWNDSGRFISRWVHLEAGEGPCVFLPPGQRLSLPIAHGEGKFIVREPEILQALQSAGQVTLRYVPAEGNEPRFDPPEGEEAYNPNGSVDDIAGLCDPTGRVFALMPHPERYVRVTHHPQWTRRDDLQPDGRVIFRRAAEYCRG